MASICFKHGPPGLLGTELEWTVHHAKDPTLPIDPDHLAAALGPHCPPTLHRDGRNVPLPAGSPVTVEPGGQVEISAPPRRAPAELIDSVLADQQYLSGLLADAGLVLGDAGLDPYRSPRRILHTPRYAAMERAFAPLGEHGITMMGATAGLQVCVDAGTPASAPLRWAAASALGPPLVAAFATSPVGAGGATGWASARMRAVLGTDPARTLPLPHDADPVAAWVRRVLDTRVLCIRGPGDNWDAPAGLTFADWVAGGGPRPPTVDDLDYHISTQFPPVRPRGYLEIRYLDAQPGTRWTVPLAVLAAVFGDDRVTEAALEACLPVADQWYRAAERGLADDGIARAAATVLDLAVRALPALGLTPAWNAAITADLHRIHARTQRRDS
ncbi:glutamate--cysteine ligase [Labedaea rhizosphaerae]|uniref:Glutamate--cysteine ligase EgtA n=1 Tax=Labedaea rhizosphaerae TaxID=598644 RepID=A0A4R6RYM6_LABRH|nr:glutamate--cysteine ligase [Labedaea rhizosphaerae]